MSAAKAKGTAAETAVAACLRLYGFPAVERRALAGKDDRGDISGLNGFVIEVKNQARLELAAWVDEAVAESRDEEIPVVWHKRRGYIAPTNWYVTMPGWAFIELLREVI